MRLPKTRMAMDYWMKLFSEAGNHPYQDQTLVWPERSAIMPSQCASILGDMFILDLTSLEPTYRLAGTRLCSLFGAELREQPFAGIYRAADRNIVSGWADQLHNEKALVLLCSRAANMAGETVTLETLLMPLSNCGRMNERLLGVTVPAADPYWMGDVAIDELTLLTIRSQALWRDLTSLQEPSLSPIEFGALPDQPAMRKVRHLGVLEGGLSGVPNPVS